MDNESLNIWTDIFLISSLVNFKVRKSVLVNLKNVPRAPKRRPFTSQAATGLIYYF